jgi:cupin superfamily acireductone dioxygenase involved in methionine salvage
MKKGILAVILGLAMVVLGGCASTMMGTPYAIEGKADTYDIPVFASAWASVADIDATAKAEINNLMQEHGYKSYTIVHQDQGVLTNKRYYTVVFAK